MFEIQGQMEELEQMSEVLRRNKIIQYNLTKFVSSNHVQIREICLHCFITYYNKFT